MTIKGSAGTSTSGAAQAAPPLFERVEKHSRARDSRHYTRAVLDSADPEEIAAGLAWSGDKMHTRRQRRLINHAKGKAEPTRRGGTKHWKEPFWKRRNAQRARKAEMLHEIARTA